MEMKGAACVGVFNATRRLFHRLKEAGDALHADTGVTTAMRAVMEDLDRHGAQTVSQMARRRPVTRQHIQALADALMRRKLIESFENPAHKRSPLLRLTSSGRQTFQKMLLREGEFLSALKVQATAGELRSAEAVLLGLIAALEKHGTEP